MFDGIGPHANTVRKYVNSNIAGMSPLKPGVKGNVPAWVFKTLCVAFESNKAPPLLRERAAEDEEELVRIANREIDMSETYLGRYAALQKRNAVAAVLDFSTEEWESLKALREAEDAEETAETATANNNNDDDGTLEAVNGMLGGIIDEGPV